MKLVIVAGGKGTRLGFSDIPKPMVLVYEKPILEHQIELAKRYGIVDVYVLLGHLSEAVVEYFGNGEKFGINITYIVEETPLGTAGALKQLESIINDRFLVFYGDTIMDINLEKMIEFDSNFSSSIATLLVHPNDHPHDSDLIEVDIDRKIIAVHAKPHAENKYLNNLANASLYIFSPEIFSYINAQEKSDLGKDIFPYLVSAGREMRAYITPEYIKDMGTPERLVQVTSDVVSGRVSRLNKAYQRKVIFLDRDGVINEEKDIIKTPDEFKLIEGVAGAINKINKSEYLAIVVTNQPGIAKGFHTIETLDHIHKKMEFLLGNEGAYIDGLYYCPHHPEQGFPGEIIEFKIDCDCRKPKTGLINQAVKDFNIDLANSFFIGDSTTDILTAQNAGLKSILVKTGYAGRDQKHDVKPDFELATLKDAINHILRN